MSKECLTFDDAMNELGRYMVLKSHIHFYETDKYLFEFRFRPDKKDSTYEVTVKPKETTA